MNRKDQYDPYQNDYNDLNYDQGSYHQDTYQQPYQNMHDPYDPNAYQQSAYDDFQNTYANQNYHDPNFDNQTYQNQDTMQQHYGDQDYDPFDNSYGTYANAYQTQKQEPYRGNIDTRYDGAYMNAQKEPEKKKKRKFLFWLIFFVALLLFLYSAFNLFKILKANWDEKRETDRMVEIGNIPEDPESAFSVNWEGLREVNENVAAWIIVPDTNISYPIVQGSDNSYYLDHTFAKEPNYAGAIFIDYHNKPDFSDNNTFIYGHNVKHSTMFSQLEKFVDREFFDQHKYVYIFTPQQNYKCEVISFHSTYDGSPFYRFGITDIEAWKDYIKDVTDPNINGYVRSDVTMGASDRMVTLSTCSYEINDEASERRYLMHLKLVPWIGQYKETDAQGPSNQ